jgi:hypothetical protein
MARTRGPEQAFAELEKHLSEPRLVLLLKGIRSSMDVLRRERDAAREALRIAEQDVTAREEKRHGLDAE